MKCVMNSRFQMQTGLVVLTQIVHMTPSSWPMEDVVCVNLSSEPMMQTVRHVLKQYVLDPKLCWQMENALHVKIIPIQTVLEDFASNQVAKPQSISPRKEIADHVLNLQFQIVRVQNVLNPHAIIMISFRWMEAVNLVHLLPE